MNIEQGMLIEDLRSVYFTSEIDLAEFFIYQNSLFDMLK